MPTAFDPITLGGTALANRLVMAPMSRSRSYGPDACPNPSASLYYAQRATAGLIVTEGIQPSPIARGYPATPGLFSLEQVSAWRKVTQAVHADGGVIFAQLMHAGRIGHPSLLPAGVTPVAPSAVTAAAQVFTPGGPRSCVQPRELSTEDITRTVGEFVTAAQNAVDAGFDGIELHGGNGFLLHQFLSPATNLRADEWGGDAARRQRFVVELAHAVATAIGPHRVGIQLSPGNPHNDMAEPELTSAYLPLVEQLNNLGLAYLAVLETQGRVLTRQLREQWSQVFVLNPDSGDGPTGLAELDLIDDGTTDMVSYGKLFLANPDLPRRLAAGGPFTTPDPTTFYGGGDRGYVDYPTLA